jgi:hypothetical protein
MKYTKQRLFFYDSTAGLAQARVSWSDVYKTDVMWTTPSASRDECAPSAKFTQAGWPGT